MTQYRCWRKTFFILAAALIWLSPVLPGGVSVVRAAPPSLDGLMDGVYLSNGYSIDYEGFYPQANATLYVIDDASVDPTYIWVAWVVSKAFNDNSYGNNRHSSWPGGHEWDDLLESDLQRLDLENLCGETVLDATMDYIDGPPYHGAYGTPSGYDVNMDATESLKLYINGGDWGKMAYKTSLVGNLNSTGYCSGGNCSVLSTDLFSTSPAWADEPSYTPASPYDNWEYDLIWELRIDRSVFVSAACPQGGILGVATNPVELHASPSKANASPVTLIRATSAIGDYVWLDADRDGVQDVSEKGIANVTVALYSDPNGDGDHSDGSLIAITITDANGGYLFPDLGAGNYVVDVTDDNGVLADFSLTTGSTDPHGPIVLGRDENYLDADFGYAPSEASKATLGDFVWSDADNDGMQDPGEPGIGGVTIQLLADNDGDGNYTDVVSTTVTADDGFYLFANVNPDDYVVDVTDTAGVLSGYTLTVGPQSRADPTSPITLKAGDVYLNADFGYYKAGLGTIGNQIWLDGDGDGLFEPGDGETGCSDVTVSLVMDSNGNGQWDAGELVVATVTAYDGTYQFSGLSLDDGDGDADYLAHVTDLNDVLRRYRKSIGPSPGSDNNSQADPYAVAVSAASPSNQTADFGYYFDQGAGLVGDTVWYDLNGNGIQDDGEPGIAGVGVELWSLKKNGSHFEKIGVVTTDTNGNYYFPNQDLNGNQREATVLASNFDPGGPLEGFTGTNQPDNVDESVALGSSSPIDLSLDFGYRFATTVHSLGDTVWHDYDGDGVQDAGEPGIEDVTVDMYMDTDGNGQIGTGEPRLGSGSTNGSGVYQFHGLGNGHYIVRVTDKRGKLKNLENTNGGDEHADSISGADNWLYDFGYWSEPTLVRLSSFGAFEDAGRAVVFWETSSEIDTVGFYLWRLDEATGEYRPLNSDMVPANLDPAGGWYCLVDETAQPGGTYTYKLVEIEFRGAQNEYGPFTVEVYRSQGR